MADDEYTSIKTTLLRQGKLFEDKDFPATSRSIRKDGNVSSAIQWKRPTELVRDPKFIVDGATLHDMHQGDLGDCWVVAAVGCLAVTNQKLLERVVPPDQTFDKDYAGIFRFNFWQYDQWVQVIVDDRIPTKYGQPIFAQNRQFGEMNEFWVSLLEKAYAKLYGGYENIDGGNAGDALVDFTGGISERVEISKDRKTLKTSLYEVMQRTCKMASMMSCSIKTKSVREEDLGNGLFAGHAYSVTMISKVKIGATSVNMLRLRNPWGRGEWTGAWGDRSSEWRHVSEADKKLLGLMPKADGEFWMAYEDWIEQFDDLDFCHLYPDALTKEVAQDMEKRLWDVTKYHSEWVRGFNAGGAGNEPHADLFWTNPQFALTFSASDDADNDGKCALIVSLMQKQKDMNNDLYIAFQIHKLKEGSPVLLTGQNYDKTSLLLHKVPHTYTNAREITGHVTVDPGTYVIIPTTFDINQEGAFYMRVFSERKTDSVELDTPTVITRPEQAPSILLDAFMEHSNGDRRIDASELQSLLSAVYRSDIQRGFGIEVCRNLIAMMDRDQSGLIDFEEFRKMIAEINVWKDCFKRYDTDKSGDIDTYEIGRVFDAIGFVLSRNVTASIVRRYGGKNRRLMFEDFIQCCTKIVVMYGYFKKNKKAGDTTIKISLEEWLATTMLY